MKNFYEDYWEHRKNIDHLYSEWKPNRLQIAAEELSNRGCQSILDVGCGEGSLGELLPQSCSVYGIDISETALEIANKHYAGTSQADIENDPILDIFNVDFDAIVCLEVLEHLFHPDNFLESLSDNLSAGTTIIISVPNFVYWGHRMKIISGDLPDEYTLYQSSEHISHFTPESLEDLVESSGISIKDIMYDVDYPIISDSIILDYLGTSDTIIPDSLGNMFPGFFAQQMVVVGEV